MTVLSSFFPSPHFHHPPYLSSRVPIPHSVTRFRDTKSDGSKSQAKIAGMYISQYDNITGSTWVRREIYFDGGQKGDPFISSSIIYPRKELGKSRKSGLANEIRRLRLHFQPIKHCDLPIFAWDFVPWNSHFCAPLGDWVVVCVAKPSHIAQPRLQNCTGQWGHPSEHAKSDPNTGNTINRPQCRSIVLRRSLIVLLVLASLPSLLVFACSDGWPVELLMALQSGPSNDVTYLCYTNDEPSKNIATQIRDRSQWTTVLNGFIGSSTPLIGNSKFDS